jgi:excisionase family DNA binding protein
MSRSTESFLAPWQAADYAGLTIDAIYALLASGELTGEQTNGRWRIRTSVLDTWLDTDVSPEELEQLVGHMPARTAEYARKLLEHPPED